MEGNIAGSPTSPNEEGRNSFLFVKFIFELGTTSSIDSFSYGRIWSSSNTERGTRCRGMFFLYEHFNKLTKFRWIILPAILFSLQVFFILEAIEELYKKLLSGGRNVRS